VAGREGHALPVDLCCLKVENPPNGVGKDTDVRKARKFAFRLGCTHPVIDQSLDDEYQGG
jgi:hypothetical protein